MLEAGKDSRIYAGLQPVTTAENLRSALANGSVTDQLTYFTPKPGDAVFLPAGTVHSLGDDVVVFEIQQNSDVTFRLYDWNHVDAKTGKPRALQVDQAIACINFEQGKKGPVVPVVEATAPVMRERLFDDEHFRLWRILGESSFNVGAPARPRVLVCLDGNGQLENDNTTDDVAKGDVLLIPAAVGVCVFRPNTPVTLLEIALPE